jgi:hypothetical protein
MFIAFFAGLLREENSMDANYGAFPGRSSSSGRGRVLGYTWYLPRPLSHFSLKSLPAAFFITHLTYY